MGPFQTNYNSNNYGSNYGSYGRQSMGPYQNNYMSNGYGRQSYGGYNSGYGRQSYGSGSYGYGNGYGRSMGAESAFAPRYANQY